MPMPLPRRNREVPSSFASFTAAAFPQLGDGRLPHYSYRGLLSIHSRFGLQLRQVAKSDPSTRDSGGFVTSTTPPVATGWNDPCRTGLAPAKHQTPFQGVPNLPKITPSLASRAAPPQFVQVYTNRLAQARPRRKDFPRFLPGGSAWKIRREITAEGAEFRGEAISDSRSWIRGPQTPLLCPILCETPRPPRLIWISFVLVESPA